MDLKEFGKYMAELRKKNGYKSQRHLAEVSGISNGTIARIENGTQQPSMATINALAMFFEDINLLDLYEKAGHITPQQKTDAEKIRYYYTGKEPKKDVEEILFTEEEKMLLDEKDLTVSKIKEKYRIDIDGREMTDDEIEELARFIKAWRATKKERD
ncbi:helix-turn-helix domain-containing protein [Halalkalibacterium halodurans]|uniref:helix-turn-helix domain-containing protein n=1 Tax=Halalkalibacterium halodurans TaxID=86665 RepID=UPI002E219036|nr:helix-turn-helix domain-containing protein [Halalkalibacterium halodurans]MED4105549.1 helix-turn-helix domain-containing protein [Halalkalibacterium halodurans]MED4109245.1 helix-turn-helix domain-containing protein [Halalkalibacterium halodurans]MED4149741.1 helix-turn-helix domain-containing protein [Halalkalibacterium halodurans]